MSENKRKDIHNSDIPVVCRSCEARHGGICGVLQPDQLQALSKQARITAHARDTDLLHTDLDNKTFSNILGGVIKLMKVLPDGRQQIVGLQFAPDFLGRPFSDTSTVRAEAATDVRLCSFPKSVVEKIIRDTPDVEQRLHDQHLRELDEAREWMLTLGRKSALEKVASFILMLVSHIDPEHDGDPADIEISLPLKRADIADFLGLTIETVSRQVTNLRKRDVISVTDRRAIVVINKQLLEKLATEGNA